MKVFFSNIARYLKHFSVFFHDLYRVPFITIRVFFGQLNQHYPFQDVSNFCKFLTTHNIFDEKQ